MTAKSEQVRAVIPARTPVRIRAALIIAGLIAVLMIWGNLKPHATEGMVHVVIPWLGVTEAAILLIVLWPAWRGHLWAVGLQAAVLLFVVVHSYWLLINDPWMGGAGNPARGNAEVWDTGIGEVFVVVNFPLLVVILFEVHFVIGRLRKSLSEP